MKIPPELDNLSKRELVRLILKEREEFAQTCLEFEKRIRELERKLLAYENAHTPPSQDRRHYPKPEPGSGKLGAPEGHRGVTREKPEPTESKNLSLNVCPCCKEPLGKPRRVEKRVIEEIPEPKPLRVIEFLIPYYYCERCKKEITASDPELPKEGNLGVNLQSQITLMKYEDRMPCRKIASSLNRQYGLKLCAATILSVLWRVAKCLKPFYENVKQELRSSPIINADETGAKVQGRKNWLWIFTTTTLAFFCFSKKREGKTIKDALGDNYQGIVGCDGYKPYEKHAPQIQRCWAHLLREAKYLTQKHQGQAQLLYEALRKMFNKIKKVTTETIMRIRERTHDKLLKELKSWTQTCKAYAELRKFATTIENGMEHWFTCITHPEIEPTNNKAERGLREFVVQRKITGTLRNDKGTTTTQTLLTAITTWKIRGLNTHNMLRTILSS